jgi:hypothetical protein
MLVLTEHRLIVCSAIRWRKDDVRFAADRNRVRIVWAKESLFQLTSDTGETISIFRGSWCREAVRQTLDQWKATLPPPPSPLPHEA